MDVQDQEIFRYTINFDLPKSLGQLRRMTHDIICMIGKMHTNFTLERIKQIRNAIVYSTSTTIISFRCILKHTFQERLIRESMVLKNEYLVSDKMV